MGIILKLMTSEYHSLPLDHPSITEARKMINRAANLNVVKEWLVEGPYKDEENGTFFFIVQNNLFGCFKQVTIPEEDFVLNQKAVAEFVGKLVVFIKDMEIANAVGMELQGTPEAQLDTKQIAQRATGKEIIMSNKVIRLTPPENDKKNEESVIQIARK